MKVQPVTTEHIVECPSCKAAVLQVRPTTMDVPGQAYWLRDGDTVPNVRRDLTAEQCQNAFTCTLLMGNCYACNSDYYAIEATFVESDQDDVIYDFMAGALEPVGELRNFVCELGEDSKAWVLSRTATSAGCISQHVMGPFPLNDRAAIAGANGVSACNATAGSPWTAAKDLLVARWDALRNFNALAVA